MPILSCYVDDRTFAILERQARTRGRGETIEQLAEAAIESEAVASLPRGAHGMHFEGSAAGQGSLRLSGR